MTPQYYNLFFFIEIYYLPRFIYSFVNFKVSKIISSSFTYQFFLFICHYLYFTLTKFLFLCHLENILNKYLIYTQVAIYFLIPDIFIDFVIEENATYG